ncbi:YciI family protein [Tautonia sociabilis]|uniref:YciI family protein n=1 Tax=Tautonia sociabilis TaxID=2080755 RepID=A0A432MIB2_9BACT|nr:YciI family protein [Tautonia sociabilis]RUL87102.1 YciI family protein [Tautonia sociabilis]
MKYMLLIYSEEGAWTDEAREHCYEESMRLGQELREKGQYLGSSPLEPVASATSVRVREGKPLVTDGPFAETREQLGGFFLVEARDRDEAIAIAGRIPAARVGTVEIRPVTELPGLFELGEGSLAQRGAGE